MMIDNVGWQRKWAKRMGEEHSWFALWPVRLTWGEHKGAVVWLEKVAKKADLYTDQHEPPFVKGFEYRTLREWTIEKLEGTKPVKQDKGAQIYSGGPTLSEYAAAY